MFMVVVFIIGVAVVAVASFLFTDARQTLQKGRIIALKYLGYDER